MYLKLSVAGHLTIFQTRTRGPWWSTRPAWILLAAVCGTQAVATLIAVYGVSLVTPLGWKYAGIVWGYALAWFLVTDPVKLLAYKVLNKIKAEEKPGSQPVPDAKADAKPDDAPPKPDAKPDAKAEDPEPVPDAKPDAKPDDAQPVPDAKADAKPDEPEPVPDAKPDAKPNAIAPAAPKPDAPAAAQPPVKPAATEPAGGPASEPTPQLVERVHKLYEELGRQDVQSVEAWEQAHRAAQRDEPDK